MTGDFEGGFGPEEYDGPEQRITVAAEWSGMVSHKVLKDGSCGPVAPSVANATLILGHDGATAGLLCWDELRQVAMWRARFLVVGHPPIEPGPVEDAHSVAVQSWLARATGQEWTLDHVGQAILTAARYYRRDPVREYLDALTWDGVPRVWTWLSRYLGTVQSPYTERVGAWWLQQCVARAYEPGCQADYSLVLEGRQGRRKTSAIAALVPESDWFVSYSTDLTDYVRAAQDLGGHWIVEMAEMSSMRRRDVETAKAFLSRRVDEFRLPYGRNNVVRPRRCCFVGTTNAEVYQHDPTGARRTWGVRCTTLDVDAIVRDRDQLWAESVVRHLRGERRWPDTDEELAMVAEEAEARREPDPWEEVLAKYAESRPWVSSRECLAECGLEPKDRSQLAMSRVHHCAMALGWRQHKQRGGPRGWYTTPEPAAVAPVRAPVVEPEPVAPEQGCFDDMLEEW